MTATVNKDFLLHNDDLHCLDLYDTWSDTNGTGATGAIQMDRCNRSDRCNVQQISIDLDETCTSPS